MTKKRRSIPWFAIGLGIYALALLTAAAFGLNILSDKLASYEAGLPEKAAAVVFDRYFAGDLTEVSAQFGEAVGPYETRENYLAALGEATGDEPLRYFEKVTSDQTTHTYTVAAGKVRVGEFVIAPAEEEGKWVLQNVSLTLKPEREVAVTVWAGSELYLNGVRVDETLAERDDSVPAHVSTGHLSVTKGGDAIAEPPYAVTYTVGDLYCEPEVTVKAKNGTSLEVTEKNGVYTASFPYDDDRIEELRDVICLPIEEYCKFMHKTSSHASLASCIDKNSTFYKDLGRTTVEWVRSIVKYRFDKEELSEMVFYSDDVFSCRAHVEEAVLGTGKRDYYTYVVDCRVYFHKTGGKWMLYDMDFAV